jgi:hypothetical protein
VPFDQLIVEVLSIAQTTTIEIILVIPTLIVNVVIEVGIMDLTIVESSIQGLINQPPK